MRAAKLLSHVLVSVASFAIVALAAPLALAMERAEVESAFGEAIAAFEAGNRLIATDEAAAQVEYEKATLRLEQIIREGGVENGKLYYNLGNVWFQRGDLGRAIVNYLRAEQYMPNNINLQQNLAYVRQQRKDAFEQTETRKVLNTLFFWHYDVPSGIRLRIFSMAFLAFWGFAAARLFYRHGAINGGLAVTGVLAVLLFVSLTVEARSYRAHPVGVVIAQESVARKGDGETYQPSFSEPLHAGTEFTVLEVRGDWLHASLPDERTCWLSRRDVALVSVDN
jgi:tetratricopeptide (TPR) repeat protein